MTSTLATNVGRADADMGSLFIDRNGESGVYGELAMRCRACDKANKAVAVRGKYVPSIACNAKCLSSKSAVCECSCGGKNHGAGWSAR